MKKFFMLAIVLTSFASATFAETPSTINNKVLSTFGQTFENAQDVRWEVKGEIYKVTFRVSNQVMFAYYNAEGNEIAVSRNITLAQLPMNIGSELRENLSNAWITDLFEIVANGETTYYATVENGTHVTILRADIGGRWMVFQKAKK